MNKDASHYVKLFGGNKIGNLIFWLLYVIYVILLVWENTFHIHTTDWRLRLLHFLLLSTYQEPSVANTKKNGVFITNFNWLMEIMAIHQESYIMPKFALLAKFWVFNTKACSASKGHTLKYVIFFACTHKWYFCS